MASGKVIAITAIDTDMGKTLVTGLLAKYLFTRGLRVTTQKICQTGSTGTIAPDIIAHRNIMGIELTAEDFSGLTCPYLFKEPCSPHLAAQLENTRIDCARITAATQQLASNYDVVLLEGVGGLMVPLLPELTLVDYLQDRGYDLILVSCAGLGSINHTLATLEIMSNRRMNLLGMVYNRFMDSSAAIAADSRDCFIRYLNRYGYPAKIVDLQHITASNNTVMPDFSVLLDEL